MLRLILHIWSGCGGLLNGPITGRPPPMPWGMGGPIAALAVSRCAVPQTARFIRAGRGSPRVGTYRTRSQRVSDQEDRTGVVVFTREALRDAAGGCLLPFAGMYTAALCMFMCM